MSTCNCPINEASHFSQDLTAIIGENFSLSYKELNILIENKMKELENFSLKAGDLLAIYTSSKIETISLFFASWRLGASICPLNFNLPEKHVQISIDELKPKLFYDGAYHCFEGRKIQAQSLLLFTSGSTGNPKIAQLSLMSLLINAQNSLDLEPNDRYLLSLPLYHVGGVGILLRSFCAKAAVALSPLCLSITHLSYVPTQLYRRTPVYKNLKAVVVGGAPLTMIPKYLPIYGTYGLTEMGSMVLLKKDPTLENGSIFLGKPLPKREIKLDLTGEILVRGETCFNGYLNEERKEKTWFHTGDIGIEDPKKGIAIIGRKDWQFFSGGENIQPEEIEKFLLQVPEIAEAIVVPKKDPDLGSKPVAFVCIHRPITEKKILSFLSKHLPSYKLPATISVLDKIPKKGIKPDRKKLTEQIPSY